MSNRLIKDAFGKWESDIDELLSDLTEENLKTKAEKYQKRTYQLLKLYEVVGVLSKKSIHKEFFFEIDKLKYKAEINAIFSNNHKYIRKEISALQL